MPMTWARPDREARGPVGIGGLDLEFAHAPDKGAREDEADRHVGAGMAPRPPVAAVKEPGAAEDEGDDDAGGGVASG